MTMTDRPNDLLLLAGKILSIFMQAAMAFGGIVLMIVIPAIFIMQGQINAELIEETGDPSITLPVFLIVGVMLIGLVILAALFVFFGKLRQIIGTVGDGDPFAPANADRLSLMGWLMLAVQLAVIPATMLGVQLAQFADKFEDSDINIEGGFDLDLTGILIVILLFILSRVFKHGARMREDLEGTV